MAMPPNQRLLKYLTLAIIRDAFVDVKTLLFAALT
jgi:hypothetical protein